MRVQGDWFLDRLDHTLKSTKTAHQPQLVLINEDSRSHSGPLIIKHANSRSIQEESDEGFHQKWTLQDNQESHPLLITCAFQPKDIIKQEKENIPYMHVNAHVKKEDWRKSVLEGFECPPLKKLNPIQIQTTLNLRWRLEYHALLFFAIPFSGVNNAVALLHRQFG